MKNNCSLSTYYGQGTIQILALVFPLANIQEFSSITNYLVFLCSWLEKICGYKLFLNCHFINPPLVLSTQ